MTKEKTEGTQKIDLGKVQEAAPELKPEVKPAPKPKTEPAKPKEDPVQKKVKSITARHKNLPFEVLEQIKKSKTGMEAKRKLKEHLQAASPA